MIIHIVLSTVDGGELERRTVDTRNIITTDPDDSEVISDIIKGQIDNWLLGPGDTITIAKA